MDIAKLVYLYVIKNYKLRLCLERISSRLPHNFKRCVFRSIFRRLANEHDSLRAEESLSEYSLRQFDESESIFVHIPKCAGSSLALSLYGNMGYGHKTVSIYQLIYDRKTYNRYFKFCFVRNPWARIVSAFEYLKNGGGNDEDGNWSRENIKKNETFEEFVVRWVNEKSVLTNLHFIPQHMFVYVGGVQEVDFIGRVENLDDDCMVVARRLNKHVKILNVNQSEKDHLSYREYYNEKTMRIVKFVYAKDIDAFNYEF